MSENNASAADINLELPSLSLEDKIAYVENLVRSSMDIQYWLPILIAVFALLAGSIIRKVARPKLISVINGFKISYRMNKILKNLTKLILPGLALVIVSIAQAIFIAVTPDTPPLILASFSKLLVAWIIIRIISQVIENGFIRQTVALFCWVIAALSILNVMDQAKYALDAVGMNFGDFRLSLLTVLKLAIAIAILLTVTRLLTKTVERSLHNSTDLSPSARVLLVKITKITLIALAILIGVTSAGIDLSALAIFGGALGLGIGFGLQKVISNLFSGMLLLIDKSIKPGDIIEIQDGSGVFGWVGQLGARYVSLITRDNKEYLIPNENFITQPVINWSYTDRKIRVETKFGVSYDSDPHLVKKISTAVAEKTKRVCADPGPVCHLVEFGDSSLNFVLRYWIEDAENGVTNTKGDVMLALWDEFKANNITIPFPHRVLIQEN